jgi:hypothetical protein
MLFIPLLAVLTLLTTVFMPLLAVLIQSLISLLISDITLLKLYIEVPMLIMFLLKDKSSRDCEKAGTKLIEIASSLRPCPTVPANCQSETHGCQPIF